VTLRLVMSPRFLKTMRRAGGFFRAVASGTTIAFLFLLFQPMLAPLEQALEPYLKLKPPFYTSIQVLIVLLALSLIGAFSSWPKKVCRSLRLGLIPFPNWIWATSAVVFWISLEYHHFLLAWSSIALAGLSHAAVALVDQGLVKPEHSALQVMESDLPVPESGEDLLGRREIIEGLVSRILLEQPQIIAVTGVYGEGKTSLLNLTCEFRKF
jgi:hypothetical protein